MSDATFYAVFGTVILGQMVCLSYLYSEWQKTKRMIVQRRQESLLWEAKIRLKEDEYAYLRGEDPNELFPHRRQKNNT
ncbi:hypothetical protein [Hymenobacter sp. BT491]|uniref:hypothetical protein n=1 Tax=Hymenobacter sp. BT491 TaxID=2766779 RepID=UPI0016537209|nr:hypothetical protein [Hymenobacter sp. BT491]MBC6988959.1 hypothetical protein [Hymenobacter sp. BT491]